MPTSSRTFSISTAASTSSAASAARAASMAKASSKSVNPRRPPRWPWRRELPARAAASAYSAAAAASAAATNSSAPSISSSMVQFTASMAISSSSARMRATALLCLACPPGVCAMFAAYPSRLRSAATAGLACGRWWGCWRARRGGRRCRGWLWAWHPANCVGSAWTWRMTCTQSRQNRRESQTYPQSEWCREPWRQPRGKPCTRGRGGG